MKSGFCPKCESNEVKRYSRTAELQKFMQNAVTVSVTDYVCFNCGYMESYASNTDLGHLKLKEESNKGKDKKKKRNSL